MSPRVCVRFTQEGVTWGRAMGELGDARWLERRGEERRRGDRRWVSAPRSNELARQIWHDVQTELATIGMLVSTALTDVRVPEQTRLRLQSAEVEVRQLEEMLRRAFLRPGPPEPVDLDAMCAQLVETQRATSSTELSLTPGARMANVDAAWLRRALLNLIQNAVRAAGPDGRVDVLVAGSADEVWVEVADDGPGFGAAEPGLASLGLRIVQAFASGHGGRMRVLPAGSGCRVRLEIPVSPALSTPA